MISPMESRAILGELCGHLATVASGLGYDALSAKLCGVADCAADCNEAPNLADALLLQLSPDGRDIGVYLRGLGDLLIALIGCYENIRVRRPVTERLGQHEVYATLVDATDGLRQDGDTSSELYQNLQALESAVLKAVKNG